MCIFSHAVGRVSNTKILYALLSSSECDVHNRWAVTAYSNSVELANGTQHTTMLLPVPAPHTSVILLNRKRDKTVSVLFDSLHDLFKPPRKRNVDRGRGGMTSSSVKKLDVVRSGSYYVSLVPDHASLNRLDTDTFDVSDELAQTLRHYETGYSFLAFKLCASAAFQPFTYAYPLSAECTVGFIPTRHFHPHAHASSSSSSSSSGWSALNSLIMNKRKSSTTEFTDDWDHDIYVLGVDAQMFRPAVQSHRLKDSTKSLVLNPLLRFIAKAVKEPPGRPDSESDISSELSTDSHSSSSASSSSSESESSLLCSESVSKTSTLSLRQLVDPARLTASTVWTAAAADSATSSHSVSASSMAASSSASTTVPSSYYPIRDVATKYVIRGRHENEDVRFNLTPSLEQSAHTQLESESAAIADSEADDSDVLQSKRQRV